MQVDRASRKEVLAASKVPIIEELIREKRLRWFGHLIREKEGEEALKIEKQNHSKWYQQLINDLTTRKLSVAKAEVLALEKITWRSLSSAQRCRVQDSNHDATVDQNAACAAANHDDAA